MARTNMGKRVFLLEGRTDRIVVKTIVQKLGVVNAEFVDFRGIGNLLKDLTAHIKESEAESIGIIVDANKSLERRWQSVRDRLIRSDLKIALPEEAVRQGMVQVVGDQRIGFWVMPDNVRQGAIEDFVKDMISEDDVLELAVEYVANARAVLEAKGMNINDSKAELYAWLAIMNPEKKVSEAFLDGLFQLETENYKNFRNWIRKLCE